MREKIRIIKLILSEYVENDNKFKKSYADIDLERPSKVRKIEGQSR